MIDPLLVIMCLLVTACVSSSRDRQVLDIDLQQNQVTGSSDVIDFLYGPSASRRDGCDGRAVLRIDMRRRYKLIRFVLHYARPRLWTFHVSDTLSYGFASVHDNTTTLHTSEAHIVNKQLRVYSNQLPGYNDASINGGLLLRVDGDVIDVNSRFVITVSDQRMEWQNNSSNKQHLDSKYLLRTPLHPSDDPYMYVGLNRAVGGDFRSGSGLCRASVVLIASLKREYLLTQTNVLSFTSLFLIAPPCILSASPLFCL